jgi:hypothetical protein
MATRAKDARLNVAAFLAAYAGREERWELVDGAPRMIAGTPIKLADHLWLATDRRRSSNELPID